MRFRGIRHAFALTLLFCLSATDGFALPFNDDMVHSPSTTGKIMRSKPVGVVALGSLKYKVQTREEAMTLANPIKGDAFSTANGERLFQVNCTPCHGDIAAKPYKPGAVTRFIPGPNLSVDMYHDKPSDPKSGTGRSDGSIYGTITFGSLSTLMPPLGYKLSPTERWDLVNYIRKVQESTN